MSQMLRQLVALCRAAFAKDDLDDCMVYILFEQLEAVVPAAACSACMFELAV